MKVLVTGGAGFIGSHLVEELVNEKHQVVVLDNLSTGKKDNLPSNVLIYPYDILNPKVEEVFQIEKPEIVFHLAAQISVNQAKEAPSVDADENIVGTVKILEQCVKHNIKKFIFASSAAVYGDPTIIPTTEETSLLPKSFYGLSKRTAEDYIQMYGDLFTLPFTILRFSNVYGLRQNNEGESGVISIFIQRMLEGLPITVYGDGDQTRDFIFVKDVAKACVLAIQQGGSGRYNISTQKEHTLHQIIQMLQDLMSCNTKINYEGAKVGDLYNSCLSNSKAYQQLNWTPQTTIYEGLKQTVAHLIKEKKRKVI